MPFYLHLSIVLADLSSIGQFGKILLHKFREVLMLPLSLSILLLLQTKHPFLLFNSLLIRRDRISKFLCVIDLWFRRIDDVFVIVIFIIFRMLQVIFHMLFLWMSCISVEMEWLWLSWAEFLLFLPELLLYPFLLCFEVGDLLDVKLIILFCLLPFGFRRRIFLGNERQVLP